MPLNLPLRRRRLLGLSALGAAWVAGACTAHAREPGRAGRPDGPPAPPSQASAAVTPPAPAAPSQASAEVAPPTPAATQAPDDATPSFSDVSRATPEEIVQYFAGRHPRYPAASSGNFLGYSPADILESMDTAVLDRVGDRFGPGAIQILERVVATNLLDGLLAVYGNQPLLLALDAGHGGLPGVYFEPGSNGTEYRHTRETVAIVEQLAQDPRYAGIAIRRIFNDAIGDDFGLPPPEDSKARASLVIRNARASMLAYEDGAWNRAHPARQVAMHLISVHFNANSGGTLVLHQGDDVPAQFRDRSVAYARWYVDHARPALNATGLLSSDLGLVQGTGLHDDSLMYTPPLRTGAARVNPFTGNALHGPPRYAMLEASLLEQDYVVGLLKYRGLA